MEELRAAILRVKLHIDGWNARRPALVALFARDLAGVTLVATTAGGSVRHLLTVLAALRGALQAGLASRGVETVPLPDPAPSADVLPWVGFNERALPVAEDAARRLVSLPRFEQLADDKARTAAAFLELHA